MRFKTMTAALAALSLAGGPALAAPAAKLSVASAVRAGAASDGEDLMGGGSGAVLAGILALGIIAIPVVALVTDDDDDDNLPVSP